MAVPTNTYTRYTAATNVREDLADFIARQDPETTPIISSAGARPRPRRRCMSGTATPCAHPMPTTRPLTATTHRHRQRPSQPSWQLLPNLPGHDLCVGSRRGGGQGRHEVRDGLQQGQVVQGAHARHGEDGCLQNVAVLGSGVAAAKATGLGPLIYTNANHGSGGSTVGAYTSGGRLWRPLQAPHALSARPSTTPQFRPRTSARARCPKLCTCPRAQGPGLDFHRHCVQSL